MLNGVEEDVDRVWNMGDVCVKKTREYKYLGVTVTENGSEWIMDEKLSKPNQWYGRLAI